MVEAVRKVTNTYGSFDEWQRVADAIEQRLRVLGWQQTDLVRRSDVSDATIRNLHLNRATSYRNSSLSKVSEALWGTPEALWRVLRGDPVDEHAEDPIEIRLSRIESRLGEVEKLIGPVLVWITDFQEAIEGTGDQDRRAE